MSDLTTGPDNLVFGPDQLTDGPDAGGGGGGSLAMSLDSIISVSIDARTKSVSQKSFGTPLLLGSHNKYPDLIRNYDSSTCLSAMVADGFETDNPLYLMAQAALSQDPSPIAIKIGKMSAAVVATVDLTPITTTQGTVYKFSVCAKPGSTAVVINFIVGAGATVASICTALFNQINSGTATHGVTATNNVTKVTLTQAAGKLIQVDTFACLPDRRILAVRDVTPAPGSGYGAALTAIGAVDGDFYGVATDVNSKAVVLEMAALVETMKRVYAVDTGCDPDTGNVAVTTDMAFTLKAAAYKRTFPTLKQDAVLNFFGAAALGNILPRIPGQYTVDFKTMAGQFVDNGFALESAIEGKNCNWYGTLGGNNIMSPGVMSSGQFIDITIFIDLLSARIQEAVYGLLLNNPKVPFTDSGIDSVRSVIKGVLNANTESAKNPLGGLAASPAPFVFVPKAADVSPADKAARRLTAVGFQAVLSGAIHKVTLQGVVSL